MPETFPSPSQQTHSWGPPPPTAEDVRSLGVSEPEDPFGSEADEAGETTEEEGLNREPKGSVGSAELRTQGSDDVPVHLFQRTLATLDDPSQAPAKSEKDRVGFELAGRPSNNAKATLDMDAFKRLLLTGDTSALSPSTPTTPSTHLNAYQGNQVNQVDSSSNTDTSSISRHSIFEPQSEAHLDTPRTSHEVSFSDEEQEDIGVVSFSGATRTGPLTPKSHYGKVLREQGPRKVPFTVPTLSSSGFGTTSTTYRNKSDASSPRSFTDLNKPLPLPPSSHSPERKATIVEFSTQSTQSTTSNQPFEAGGSTTTQKRNPPAPPLARRHSQLRSQNTANNPERSVTISEEKQSKLTLLSDLPSTTPPKPPPPPPPRRKGTGQNTPSSDYAPGLSEVPATMLQAEQTLDRPLVKDQASKPPPLPSRTPSVSSVKRPARVSSGASSTAMAPPPPPPRRRGSSQSSLTDPRISGEYRRTSIDSYRGESTASSVNQSIPESSAEQEARGGDVLADLSALQREVDALRGKYADSRLKS